MLYYNKIKNKNRPRYARFRRESKKKESIEK